LPLLVRSWNVFHGNAQPPERRDFLAEMVRLAAEGADVVCLQEVPVWALALLDEWSGLTAIGDAARRPAAGPLPIGAELSRRVTDLHHGLFRSAFTGQANAILVRPSFRVVMHDVLVLNPLGFRRAQARALRLDVIARLAWAKERRVCQAVRLDLGSGRTAVVVNLHATSYRPDERLPDAELLRAAVFADALAEPDELLVVAGDFNITAARSRTLEELRSWGFSDTGHGIDHILVRGGPAGPPQVWPLDRRQVEGRVVSDHAPVEVRIE
jgi:endonuclease/exonuclease/phosphatase family metal-dependent hydrolase